MASVAWLTAEAAHEDESMLHAIWVDYTKDFAAADLSKLLVDGKVVPLVFACMQPALAKSAVRGAPREDLMAAARVGQLEKMASNIKSYPDAIVRDDLVLGDMVKPDDDTKSCLLYTSPSPRDGLLSRMPSSA